MGTVSGPGPTAPRPTRYVTNTTFPFAPCSIHRDVRSRGLLQRKLASDDRPQRAVRERGDEVRVYPQDLIRRNVPQRHPQDRQLLPHRLTRVDLRAAAVADDDDAAAGLEQTQVGVEIHVRQHLEDHVGSAAVGHRLHRREACRITVVEDGVGAVLEHEGASLVRAGRADHAHARRLCELHGRQTDGAAGAVHEHRFPALRVRPPEQRAMRGRGGHAEAGALAERHVGRQPEDLLGRARHPLRVGAAPGARAPRCTRDRPPPTPSRRRRPTRPRPHRRTRACREAEAAAHSSRRGCRCRRD